MHLFEQEYSDVADGMMGLRYPIRGYKDSSGEGIGALTYEEIQELKTEFFLHSWNLYRNYKLFGLPHNQGWANERQSVLSILRILEEETNEQEAWEMEKARHG